MACSKCQKTKGTPAKTAAAPVPKKGANIGGKSYVRAKRG